MSTALYFITGSSTEVTTLESVRALVEKYDLAAYRGPRVPLPGCSIEDTPEEFVREWEMLFVHFRNRVLSPLTRCALGAHARHRVLARARIACEMANREAKRRYGR
jgi:hypothetical protein